MRSISFIIPVHNEKKRLKKIFEALKEVELPRGLGLSEVIFVDNGSTDKTFLKLADFARENGNINISIISYKTKLPAKKVFLEGLKASKSHYTILLNKDLSNLKQELNKLKIKKVPNKNSLAQEENIEKLIKNYNKPESLLVISSYPKKQETYSNGVCAVASFTKNTISSLKSIAHSSRLPVLPIPTATHSGKSLPINLFASMQGRQIRSRPSIPSCCGTLHPTTSLTTPGRCSRCCILARMSRLSIQARALQMSFSVTLSPSRPR